MDSHRGKFSHQINFGLTQINDGLINDDERLTMSVNFNKGIAACDRGDYATALSLLRPLADQGDVDAQFLLGFMYDDGEGVVQDRKEAVMWYQLAADGHHPLAQLTLARAGLR